jgi:hypothetical protein
MEMLVGLIPWLLIFIFIWYFVFRYLRGNIRRTNEHLVRAQQHMDAVEAKLDRLIALNERSSDRRDPPAPPPLPR